MRRLFSLRIALIVLLSGLATGGWALQRHSTAGSMSQFATALLETLDDQQRAELQLPYDTPLRVDWHFIPMPDRKGIALREMNDAQKAASLRLVRAALSEVGYDKASQIMLLESVLRKLEGPGSEERRDPNKYYVTIFGQPGEDDAPWGLSFEGHHLSLNFVCRGDQVLSSTPQFFASNPALIKSDIEGPLEKGTRVLADEELLAFELVQSLDDSQREIAVTAPEAPAEIRAPGEAQPPTDAAVGIPHEALTESQQAVLKKLVEVYAKNVPEDVAQPRLEAIREAGWQHVHFAWEGSLEPGVGHYYRIQGPTFLIELVNTQPDAEGNPANHIHSVWRDMRGDFNIPL